MSTDKCNLTGIVVNYNSMNYINIVKKSLESLISISDKPIIVVDNNSKDGSNNYIYDTFRDEVVALALHNNYGYAGAINIAYKKFNNYLSDIFFIANNDLIIINKELVNKLCKILLSEKTVATISAILLWPSGKINSAGLLIDKLGFFHNLCEGLTLDECNFSRDFIPVSFLSGAFTLFKKSYLNLLPENMVFPIRGFMYLDDIITGLYFSQLGFKNLVVTEPLAIHYESLSLTSVAKAYLLGRALAIQRKIIISPASRITTAYKYAIYNRFSFNNKVIASAFLQGWKKGEKEYKNYKGYWDKYRIDINNVVKIEENLAVFKRITKFLLER